MRPWEIRLQHLANRLVIVTGILYAAFKYLGAPVDAYSNAPSPWEPRFHDAHVVVVPLLVFACGVIWRSHVAPKWFARHSPTLDPRKRWTGLALLGVLFPMGLSGYFVQIAVDDVWRKAWVVVHLLASALWTVSYLLHFIARRVTARRVAS